MSRYRNVTILPAEPNPWADAFGLIGSIMGKNAAERQDTKDTNAFVDSFVPTMENPQLLSGATNPQQQAPVQQGGLLSGNTLKGNITNSLAPNTSFLGGQNSPTTQATQAQAQTISQPTQQAQPQTWNDVQNQYNMAWAQKAKGILANMSPEGRKQYMQQILATRQQGLDNLKADFTKQETSRNWDAFNNETDPKKKLFYAVKNGMDVKNAQMLLDPDTDTQLVDMGGQKVLIGRNKFTNQFTNMMTGEPLSADDLTKTMTPEGQDASARGWKSLDLQQQGLNMRSDGSYYSNRGGGGGSSKASLSPEEKWATDYEVKSNGLTKDQAVIDSLYDAPYLTPAQQTQLNQALANRDKYWQITSGGEYGKDDSSSDSASGGNGVDYNTFVQNAMANGFTQEQADAYWKENAGG